VDDVKTGVAVMDELAKQMGEKGEIAILAGNQNAPNLRKRVDGVKQAAAKYPGIKIVDTFYHQETPQDAAAEVVRVQNAYPQIRGWAMIGGWPLFTQTLLTDLNPAKTKIVAVDGLPAELAYVEKGLAPVLLAQPTYLWGYESVNRIFDKVRLKKDVPAIIPMELVRVSKENLGTWARQLRDWGFTDVPEAYLKLPK
jgi:ribose transport system substrate-binding protein